MPPIAGICILIITLAVFVRRPGRLPYQLFLIYGLSLAGWYWIVQIGGRLTALRATGVDVDPRPWLQANGALSAFFPWFLSLVKESIRPGPLQRRTILHRSLVWLVVGASIALLCFHDTYAPPYPLIRGIAYNVGAGSAICVYVLLLIQLSRQACKVSAGQRLELQFLVIIPTAAFCLALLAFLLGHCFGVQLIRRVGLLFPIAGFFLMAYLALATKVRDARQVLPPLVLRAILVVMISLGLAKILEQLRLNPGFTVELITVAGGLIALGFWLDTKCRHWFRLDGSDALHGFRAQTLESARLETAPHAIAMCFEALLAEQCHASRVALLYEDDSRDVAATVAFRKAHGAIREFLHDGWVTPESLERRGHRETPAWLDMVADRSIGLVVVAPRSAPVPSLILIFEKKTDGWPYSFPEIERVQQIAELMDNILTNARLTTQAALKTKTEHLAMMSRGLAHDLKNLITPISSFLVHSEGKIAAGTVEEEVHATAKRSVRIMNDYIREALFFANRLEPRLESASTGKIFEAVREVTAARANWRQVKIIVAHESDHALVADAVLLQRMLGNLVSNAIDASSPGKTVTLSAVPHRTGMLRLSVVDQGCGIAPQHLGRIFEPYFTTKEFGEDVRGFGLGLTITQKIVHLHHGTISVQSQLGCGTAVTIDLPLTQPSSTDNMTEQSLAAGRSFPLTSALSR